MENAQQTNSPSAHAFTAAEIAAAIGRKRSSVGDMLARVPSTGVKIVSGNEARAWTVAALPPALRQAVNTLAKKLRCADGETALRQCAETWLPEIPLPECHSDCIQLARRLREALRASLNRQAAPGLSSGELESLGIEDYRREFGRTITARHWRDLFARTLRRAGSVPDFERLEIYLPDKLKRAEAPAASNQALAGDSEFLLRDLVAGFADVCNPTQRERESLWTVAMEEVERLHNSGESFNRATRIVRAELRAAAPFLAASPGALQKAFARKLSAWQASGGSAQSMGDARRNNTGNHDGFELPQEDLDCVIHLAVWQYHGSIAAAWREAHRTKLLTQGTSFRYPLAANKSHVPHKLREAIGPEVEMFMLMKRGKRAVDELTPHVTRTYEALHSCQIFQGDDFTMPVYFWIPDGRGWFNLVRGQCLLFIDFRSDKIIGWSLQPDPQYSSLVIRTLCTNIFSRICVPEMLYFERGIWQRSTLLTGRNHDGALPFGEVVQGLREFGIKFKHAIRPRSKTVERVGGLLQDLMEGEPGYCGRDERRDLPERTKRAMQIVNSGKAQPHEHFHSFDQWNARLAELIATYNATAQQGRKLAGLSPNQAFDDFMNADNPPIQLGAELRYLLAHHKEEREIKPSGVSFRVGKQLFRYYGSELGPFVGRRALCWFDVENPDALVVTTLDRRNPVLVPRAQDVSAMAELTGGEEMLANELARAAGQMSHLRARYNVVATKLPQRRPLINAGALKIGSQIDELRKRSDARKQKAARSTRAASRIGMHVAERAQVRETTPDDIKAVENFLALPSEQETSP